MSRICEEFHCTPLEALEQPYELTVLIMELRAYQRAKDLMERDDVDLEKLPRAIQESASVTAVWGSLHMIAAESRAARMGRKAKNG